MKMAKRILVGLLALAMLVSAFAFAALADEAATDEPGTENTPETSGIDLTPFEQMLEYFEQPILFDDDFSAYEAGTAYADAVLGKTATNKAGSQTATIVAADGVNHLTFASTATMLNNGDVFLNWDAAEKALDDFALDMVIGGNNLAKIFVSSKALGTSLNVEGTALVNLQFKAGKVVYAVGASSTATLTDESGAEFAVNTTGKYRVVINYSARLGTYSLKVVDIASGAEASASNIAVPVTDLMNVKIGCNKTEIAKAKIDIYSIKAVGGTFLRDTSEQAKIDVTEAAIADMKVAFDADGISFEDKLAIATIAGKIKSYGYEPATEDTIEALGYLVESSVTLYAEKIGECVDNIVDDAPYADRLANVEAYANYVDLLPDEYAEIVDEQTAEIITGYLNDYSDEVAFLEAAKDQSEKFVAALEGVDASSNDYVYLVSYYDSAKDLTPYMGCDGVPAAYEAYNAISKKVAAIRNGVEEFIGYVEILADDSKSFTERYDAYVNTLATRLFREDAKNPGELLENIVGVSTYVDEDGNTALEIDSDYLEVRAFMVEIVTVCDNFITKVKSAEYANYINAKEAFLAEAAEIIDDVVDDYAGVVDAKELYTTVSADILAKKTAAQAYIDAVNALDGLSGDALTAAIANAEELRKTGDILGVDGVSEANKKFVQISSEVILEQMSNNYFISVVEKMADAIAKIRFELIIEAKALAADVSDSFSGVADAKSDLDANIAEHNAIAQAFNSQFAAVNSVATTMVSGAAQNVAFENIVGRVIALIRGLFA